MQGTLDLLTVDVTSVWVHWYNCRAIRSQRIGRVSTGPIAPRFLSRGSSRKPSSSVNAKPTTWGQTASFVRASMAGRPARLIVTGPGQYV